MRRGQMRGEREEGNEERGEGQKLRKGVDEESGMLSNTGNNG